MGARGYASLPEKSLFMTTQRITCIVPTYNEGERILDVLSVLTRISRIDEIICVDDGSTDNTKDLVASQFPSVTLIRLQTNKGKSEAVKIGVRRASGDTILLFDADIRNLKAAEVGKAIAAWNKLADKTMIVLARIHSPVSSRLLRWPELLGGERIVRTSDIKAMYETYSVTRFQLEVALNQYFIDRNMVIYDFPFSGLNTYMLDKHSFLDGLRKYTHMTAEIISAYGFPAYLTQMFFSKRKLLV
jgi:glycosyltransferase involved in cell wall biosynthesis